VRRPRLPALSALALSLLVVLTAASRIALACPCREGDLTYSDEDASRCAWYIQTHRGVRACLADIRAQEEAQKRATEAAVAASQRVADQQRAQMAADAAAARAGAEARAALEAERERLENDPDWMLPQLSALICYDAWVYQRSVAEIRTEQAYAKRGGEMVDKAKIYELQRHMRHANENSAQTKKEILGMKRAPLPCSAKTVRDITGCMEDSSANVCGTDGVRDRITYVDVPEGPTWTCRGSNCD